MTVATISNRVKACYSLYTFGHPILLLLYLEWQYGR
jgi:hypothetical protein